MTEKDISTRKRDYHLHRGSIDTNTNMYTYKHKCVTLTPKEEIINLKMRKRMKKGAGCRIGPRKRRNIDDTEGFSLIIQHGFLVYVCELYFLVKQKIITRKRDYYLGNMERKH